MRRYNKRGIKKQALHRRQTIRAVADLVEFYLNSTPKPTRKCYHMPALFSRFRRRICIWRVREDAPPAGLF